MTSELAGWLVAAAITIVTALSHLSRILEFVGVSPKVGLRCKAVAVPYRRDPQVHEFYRHWLESSDQPESPKSLYWSAHARALDHEIKGYWEILVENSGRTTLKNVQLTIPEVVAVRFQDDPETPIRKLTPLVLGDMRPRDTRTILAWVSYLPTTKGLILVHDAGHGRVRTYRPAHPVFFWITRHWPVIVLSILLGLPAGLAIVRLFKALLRGE